MLSSFHSPDIVLRMHLISDVIRVSLTQYVVVLVVTLGFVCFVGQDAGVSALLGGLSYALPSSALALSLTLPKMIKRDYKPSAYRIFFGEFMKILSVILLWVLTVRYYETLHWPAFIWGNCGGEQLLCNFVQETLGIGIHGKRPYRY